MDWQKAIAEVFMNVSSLDYDVVVAGAGPAGCVAALQAARAGARTLLVEKSAMPGGSTTICGVNFPGLFHAWGRQVIAGIGWELASKAALEAGLGLPDFSRYEVPHWRLQIRVDSSLYACLLDEAFAASGVDVLYHAMPAAVEELEGQVKIKLAAKEGLLDLSCKVAVDATGDADLVSKAGFKLRKSVEKQPGTPMVRFGGYELDKLDLDEIERAYKDAVASGAMSYLDTGMSRSMAGLLSGHGENCIHVPVEDASSSREKSEVERLGRAAVLRIWRFLRRFKGLEGLKIEYMAPQCGVRETAVIEGEACVSVEDYLSGRRWDDSLCYSFYQIDLHSRDKDSGLRARPLEFGVVPSVPRGALTPKGSKRLLAAGRCVSSDRLANSALRVQASCMAMGQAAGAMAALSARDGSLPGLLNVDAIKALLKEHGAIVP